MNCQTIEYRHRVKRMAAPKYCQTENCPTIEMSDCEVGLYHFYFFLMFFMRLENKIQFNLIPNVLEVDFVVTAILLFLIKQKSLFQGTLERLKPRFHQKLYSYLLPNVKEIT